MVHTKSNKRGFGAAWAAGPVPREKEQNIGTCDFFLNFLLDSYEAHEMAHNFDNIVDDIGFF
jgi:hypothetical protein